MPEKRPSVKNEKQYEAQKDKGMSEGARRQDRQLARRDRELRRAVAQRQRQVRVQAGRHHRPAQGGGPQGRSCDGPQVLMVPIPAAAIVRVSGDPGWAGS